MFIPTSFQPSQHASIIEMIQQYPLATIITIIDGVPVASHVPVLYLNDEQGERLITHIARANPMWRHLDTPWLIVFTGASHYISANWYPSKAVSHKEVPTYNYQAVHITAKASLANEAAAIDILFKTTDYFENQLHNTNPDHTPWRLTDAPDEFIHKMCKALVAIEFDILDVQASFKLSQNKDAQNRQGVIDGLSQLDTHESRVMTDLIQRTKAATEQ